MFLPLVSSTAVMPPSARNGDVRGVGAVAAVHEVRRRDSEPGVDSNRQRQLEAMRSRDRELRQQQLARAFVGGGTPMRPPPSLTYERGPDGNYYAVDGAVEPDLPAGDMLDPGRAKPHNDEAATKGATGEAAHRAAPPVPVDPGTAGIVLQPSTTPAAGWIDEAFAVAAVRFYLANAGIARARPTVDVYV